MNTPHRPGKTCRPSYCYCNICGREPRNDREEPNYAPVRWWDCDDGWRIGTLCRWCLEDTASCAPKRGDYAVETATLAGEPLPISCDGTDEDPIGAL